jgi:hypothetical protein
MRLALTLAAILGTAASGAAAAPHEGSAQIAAPTPESVTVPVALDHGRMTIEVGFVRPDSSVRPARTWVDLGSEHVVVGESLARDLGLDLSVLGKPPNEAVAAAPQCPPLRIGGFALDVSGTKAIVRAGERWRPGVVADAMLPAAALRRHHVVFDYPARRMKVARPGALRPRGAAVACRVNPDTGLLQVDATIDGKTVALGIDNGSAGTWVSKTLTGEWLQHHPEWPRATGAAGSANFWGIGLETGGVLLRVPAITFGSLAVADVAVLGIDQAVLDWYSRKSAGPVSGFIGANVLTRYRLEVDFPGRMTYWDGGAESGPRDLDIVGVTVRAEADGRFTVAGVTTTNGAPAVAGVEAGDVLLRIGSLDTAGATMGAVIAALRGAPGETRTLLLGRQGRRVTVEAPVSRLP